MLNIYALCTRISYITLYSIIVALLLLQNGYMIKFMMGNCAGAGRVQSSEQAFAFKVKNITPDQTAGRRCVNGLDRVSETPSEVLTEEEYGAICRSCIRGSVRDIVQIVERAISERPFTIGPRTSCPDPIEHKPTPLVVSAQYGRTDIVNHFLKEYSDLMDINHVATIFSRTTGKRVYYATALWAASSGGYLDIVKILFVHKADVNKATLNDIYSSSGCLLSWIRGCNGLPSDKWRRNRHP